MDRLARKMKYPVIAMGVFDGVHRGHREIFRRAIARAKSIGGTSVVYTFNPHPVKVLAPLACPLMINTLGQRLALIREAGIRKVIIQRFTKAFSHKTPDQFFQETILRRLRAKEILVGYNFTFGIHRSGTTEHLVAFGKAAGIKVTVVPAYLWHETLVSSSQIRHLLSHGDLPKAEELLGRPYFMEGTVVHGRGIGGKTLKIHTANLEPENEMILPAGVYVTRTQVGPNRFDSVTNIGPNPTFGPGPLSVETHLLDFKKRIFGRRIRVEFLEKIREEITFASSSDLAQQIQNDIAIARSYLKKRSHR